MRNHTNCVNLQHLRRIESDQELKKIDTACGSTRHSCKEGCQTVAVCRLPSSQYSHDIDPICSPTNFGDARLDLRNAYHLIRFNEGDKYESAFPIWYFQFEDRGMLFRSTNAPATTPIRGDESSAEQRQLKRGMTLPEPKSSYDDPAGGAGIKDQSALND